MPNKVMVIGWDGADFGLIRPWIEAGYMPNLKRLMGVSRYGTLQSVYPPATPVAWSTIVTGKNPGKHGLNGFFKFRPNSYSSYPVNAANRRGKDVWEILSDFGKKVAVIGVPLTYPVRKVNGCMISGFLTPECAEDYCFPVGIKDEIKSRIPGYTPGPNPLVANDNFVSDETQYVKSLFYTLERHIEAITYIAKNKEWDFFMGVFNETDWVQHRFWFAIDENHPKYDKRKAEQFGGVIRDVYSRLDKVLGELVGMTNNANVLIISDHGSGPLYWSVNINYLLYKMGELRFKKSFRTRARVIFARLGLSTSIGYQLTRRLQIGVPKVENDGFAIEQGKKRGIQSNDHGFIGMGKSIFKGLLLDPSDVDWSRTDSFSPRGGEGQIFLNVVNRFPDGIIEHSQCPEVRERIINKLKELRFNNSPIVDSIYAREDLVNGEYCEHQADIQIHMSQGYYGKGGFDSGLSRIFLDPKPVSGAHGMGGIILLKDIDYDGSLQIFHHARLVDIAPTILHLMQIPTPADMDGKSLAERGKKPVMSSEKLVNKQPGSVTETGFTKDEEEDIEQKLRALGYI
jgi:predicted AlkP superfamily phosphohydrolase/phosphomutase